MFSSCWSCCCGEDQIQNAEQEAPCHPCVRPFEISSKKVKLPSDCALYRDQTLAKTRNDKVSISCSKTTLSQRSASFTPSKTASNPNVQVTKVIQNLYVTSFAGVTIKQIRRLNISVIMNATVDLPSVQCDEPKVETLRVPVSIVPVHHSNEMLMILSTDYNTGAEHFDSLHRQRGR